MAARWPILFSIYLTYGNHSAARSQTWMNESHSYWAHLWPVIGPWCTSSKILVRSNMAAIWPILDFVRMDLSAVRSQYLIMWPGHGHAWTLSIVAHWCTYPHFEILVQDGRQVADFVFHILNIWKPFRGPFSDMNKWISFILGTVMTCGRTLMHV